MTKKAADKGTDGSFVIYLDDGKGRISCLPERFRNTKEALHYIQTSANSHGSYQVQQIRSPVFRLVITEHRALVEVKDADPETA